MMCNHIFLYLDNTVGNIHTLVYNGHLYSTLADVSVDANTRTCQKIDYGGPGPLSLPSGYSIAAGTPDTIAVTKAHYWSTDLLVFINGDACFTLGGPSCCNRDPGEYIGSGWLIQSGSSYNVNECNAQILITSE